MSAYTLTRQAYCDLEEAEDFLSPRSADAAHRFIVRAVEVFELLAAHPELGRRRPELKAGLRSFSLKSHVAFYRIARGEVQILRVLPGARDAAAVFAVMEDQPAD